jgi:signal transduction histidine kinase
MAAEPLRDAMTQLITVIQELSLTRDVATVMAIVRHAARTLTGADGATFILREGDRCYYADEEAIAPLWKGQRFPLTACISGWVMIHRQPAVIADIYADPRVPAAAYRPTFVTSLVMVPIRTMAPIGAIGTYWAQPHQATPEDVQLLQALADSTAVALENIYAYTMLAQQVQERTATLHHEIAARQRVERAARHAEHFALLGRLAAGVSHEIRNPLSAIVLHVELLEEELRAPSPDSAAAVPEALAEIKRQLARLEDLVQDYLSLARVTTIERTPQDLGTLVEAWAHEWRPLAAAHGVTLQLDGITTLGPAVLHANTLRRGVFNLVHNALDAMPQGGTLTLAGQSTATQVQLRVRDTGSGIPAAQLPHIFEPLYTTKPEGTGLGLYIAQEIITAHAGQLTVESVEGHGTTFILTLPRAGAAG